jgi:hypothetical protein
MTEEEREAEEDGEDLEPFGEVRFIPSDGSAVEALFEAFSKGAEMNPDPLEGKLLQIKYDSTNHNDRG